MKKLLFGFLLFTSLAYGQSPVTNSTGYGEEIPGAACLACPGAETHVRVARAGTSARRERDRPSTRGRDRFRPGAPCHAAVVCLRRCALVKHCRGERERG